MTSHQISIGNPGKNSEIRSSTAKFAMTAKNPKKSKIKMAVVTPSIRVFWGCLNQYGNVYIYIPRYILCGARLDLAA